jgi:hypothetical protein
MMENRNLWLSPRGNVRPASGQLPIGGIRNPTLPLSYSVSRATVPGLSYHLPLTDNCKVSFWNAGKTRAALSMYNGLNGQINAVKGDI